ncbi:MAG: GTPase Era [Gammaproteobacteria bacterium]|nr:GTPase Era [Gammaproteobacteria bacterium]
MNNTKKDFRCGYVALIGRPNVGKSTLMNYVLGQKISITSHRPQTTRHRILGIKTTDSAQIVYVDTPGIHDNEKKAMNRYMNRTAGASFKDVDVIVLLVDAMRWTDEDELVINRLQNISTPVVLAVNKVDLIKKKEDLLPFIEKIKDKYEFADIIPVSAMKGDNIEGFEKIILDYLPLSEAFYDEDQITDRSSRFLAAEIIREKLTRNLTQELPYNLTVEIEKFTQDKKLLDIAAIIWVERENQKAIIIGKNGSKLKDMGTKARIDMEKLFQQKVFLQLWVKVKSGWSDDERALNSLGYIDDY